MSRDGVVPATSPGVELWCDLLCPDCSASLDDLDRLHASTTIRLRHFPLVSHTWAVPAAQIAEEARVQGVLWSVVRAILASNGDVSSPDDLVRMAERGGATSIALRRALADGRHAGAVSRDYHEGRALGITGTPTFVVQGPGAPVRLDGGRSQEGLVHAVMALLEVFAPPTG
jgi:predicted DsbA family dithiol-disulfide isomerase